MTILNGVGGLAIEGVYKDGKYLGLIYIIYIYIYRYIFSRIFFFYAKVEWGYIEYIGTR